MVKPKRTKTAQITSENASERDDPKSSIQATAAGKKKAPEKSNPEEVDDPVTVTATNTSDATWPNE